MSGRRCRALRREFRRQHGHPVSEKTLLFGYKIGATSEWRRLKRGRP